MEGKNMGVKYPPGSFVDVVQPGKTGRPQLLARCTLQADGTVACIGETTFVERLQAGVTVLRGQKMFTPKDGVAFLLGLMDHFRNPQTTFATDIQLPKTKAARSA